jgi:hypothetical protein
MTSLFIGITALNLLCLAAAGALGYASLQGAPIGRLHVLLGSMATLICCAVHCIVFTYFMATSKWIQHAVTVKQLDAALVAPTRSFRKQAFPAALAAMMIVFITAIFGAARDNYGTPRIYHHALAIASLAVNIAVAFIEYRAISRNGQLIDRILARINITPAARS